MFDTRLFRSDLVLSVIHGLTGYLDSRSRSGMTMEFGFGSPIVVGDDGGVVVGDDIGVAILDILFGYARFF